VEKEIKVQSNQSKEGSIILQTIKGLRDLRRPHRHFKPECPICKIVMKRKGKKGTGDYWKCPKCKGKVNRFGMYIQAVSPDALDIKNHEIKAFRQEMTKRKLIIGLKKQKYRGFDTLEFSGEIIDLNAYDTDGVSFEEKKRMEEQRKEAEREQKKAERKTKRKATKEKKAKK